MKVIFFTIFLIALIGSISGTLLAIRFSGANISEPISENKNDNASETQNNNLEIWEKIVLNSSSNFVGIQIFKDNKIFRQGSGIIVSSDGLIVTTADIAGYPGSIYQIFYEDKVLKAKPVLIDYKINLFLLKTPDIGSSIVELSSEKEYISGRELILVGKIIDFSKSSVASQRANISHETEKSIVLDSTPSSYLSGFGALDRNGKLRGIVYLRSGKISLIKSETIEVFFKNYIEKSVK